MHKRIASVLVGVLILLSCVLTGNAEQLQPQEDAADVQLQIRTTEEFLSFAESCRLDSYSRDLAVTLEADIDLSNTEFTCIPVFSGTFNGNNHTISGLNIAGDGSAMGLFRYLTDTAVVQDLAVRGAVTPGGSRQAVGAIAGENAGTIRNCSFFGRISGGDYVGGLAGRNQVTGIIENCEMEGNVYGDHFVGGIAGENNGVIRECGNRALINTTPQQNTVGIADITLDSLTNSEAANTVTDIGGIAGISSGVIRSCENHADVGYLQMGYNIGGIAGTQSGYIVDCINYGTVHGRKEVGGIVGQMEPSALIEYSEDTLQILQGQLGTMSTMVNRASGNAQTNAARVVGYLGLLQDQTLTAMDAADSLLFAEFPPDSDSVLAAYNTLSNALGSMPQTLHGLANATQITVYGVGSDLREISGQINAMGETIQGASETMQGTIVDISDQDTADTLTGKVEGCINLGSVGGDLNVGGIAGAMAMENDLDILEDWQRSGELSLNYESQIRAVILNCDNQGAVTVKKQNVGGIVGWQSLGLVKHSTNTGETDGSGADYVGGVVGLSSGYIRNANVKCRISGNAFVGGVAGSGTIVTDCLTMVQINGSREKTGAILGVWEESSSEEEAPVSGNYYLAVSGDIGGIDGIRYDGMADGLVLEEFLGMEALPELFRVVTVRFVFEDGTEHSISVTPGEGIAASQIPAVPEKEGFTGTWNGLQETELSEILFDMSFAAEYTAYRTVIQSSETRAQGIPILLAEGSFTDTATASIMESDTLPPVAEGEALLEAWSFDLSEAGTTLHFLLPAETEAENVRLLLCTEDGQWQEADVRQDGSYLVFTAQAGRGQLALVQRAGIRWPWIGAAVCTAGLAVLGIALKLRRNRRKPEAADRENGEV